MAVRCRVVHAIRGRLRVRVNFPQIFDGLSEAFNAFLRDQPGIQEVRLNPGCRSVVLNYNPDVLRVDDLVDSLNGSPSTSSTPTSRKIPHSKTKTLLG